jgi:hypothetical protein
MESCSSLAHTHSFASMTLLITPPHTCVLIQSEASGLLRPHPEAAGVESPVRVPSQGRHHTHHLWVARRGPRTPRGPRSQEGVWVRRKGRGNVSIYIQYQSKVQTPNSCVFLYFNYFLHCRIIVTTSKLWNNTWNHVVTKNMLNKLKYIWDSSKLPPFALTALHTLGILPNSFMR